jgi:hypothetical protein
MPLPADVSGTPAGRARQERQASVAALEPISGWFAAAPLAPARPPGDSPQNNLLDLANSYVSHVVQPGANGSQVQAINTAYAARSFQNSADFYYVLQELDFRVQTNPPGGAQFFAKGTSSNTLTNAGLPLKSNPTTIQASPETTQTVTTVTSGVSYNIGGSVGYNYTQGVNATGSAGVTISNSKTVTIPPFRITNTGNLVTGQPSWQYQGTNFQPKGAQITFYNHWISEVPFTAYAPGQTEIQVDSSASESILNVFLTNSTNVHVSFASPVPLPFGDTFALQRPVITSVSPSTVSEGDTFTIQGSGFYPSLVTGVSIGGVPLGPTQFSVVSDRQINVIAPNQFGVFPQAVVVQTSQGISNDDVTVTIH